MNPQFHSILSVKAQEDPDIFLVEIDATDMDGITSTSVYSSHPNDPYGLGPEVRLALTEWLNHGKPVASYVPPTIDEIRATYPTLTRRQLLLALANIGITEDDVTASLADPLDLIEWKNASQYSRLNPLLVDAAINFKLPPDQVDSLWLWASTS